jgi:hypothetical protein
LAQTNRTYTVLSRTNLSGAPWAGVTNILPSASVRTSQWNSAVSPLVNPELYYRVVTPLMP